MCSIFHKSERHACHSTTNKTFNAVSSCTSLIKRSGETLQRFDMVLDFRRGIPWRTAAHFAVCIRCFFYFWVAYAYCHCLPAYKFPRYPLKFYAVIPSRKNSLCAYRDNPAIPALLYPLFRRQLYYPCISHYLNSLPLFKIAKFFV